jgi:circadian clock protein KaiC
MQIKTLAKQHGTHCLVIDPVSALFSASTQGTALEISTLSDTWIHLNYLVNAGERNRSLSIIKSRGTAHSNQVRELVLNDSGVTLVDAYTAGGEVLMGTLRWEKERAESVGRKEVETMAKHKQAILDREEAELEARLQLIQRQLEVKRTEKSALTLLGENRAGDLDHERSRLSVLRGVDTK